MEVRYFDNAATTAVREEVLKEMIPYFTINYGNPSAIYQVGREAKRGMEKARQRVADAINCNMHEIYFTSCGSESDNLAIKGVAYANKEKGNHIITTKIEHHAVLNSCQTLERQGFKVTYLNVDENGTVNIQELLNSITENTILISIMFANNEIGTIEPIEKIGKIARDKNILFHVDATQAIGKVSLDYTGVDFLTFAPHKFYGLNGIGAAINFNSTKLTPLIHGGKSTTIYRSGTPPTASIVAFATALKIALKVHCPSHLSYCEYLTTPSIFPPK